MFFDLRKLAAWCVCLSIIIIQRILGLLFNLINYSQIIYGWVNQILESSRGRKVVSRSPHVANSRCTVDIGSHGIPPAFLRLSENPGIIFCRKCKNTVFCVFVESEFSHGTIPSFIQFAWNKTRVVSSSGSNASNGTQRLKTYDNNINQG